LDNDPSERLATASLGGAERPPTPSAPRSILALSGGGSHGAYTAGVLTGWTASGVRPEFDVVTGVSTGALIAPLAFLGPAHDPEIEAIYTNTIARDVYRWHSLPRLLWSDSAANSTPLRHLIESVVTPEVIDQIAAAHRAGRRLYVGTTDLDTKRQVVWDMGAIAAGTDPEKRDLFCRVLLASASVPGLMPPVAFDIDVGGRRRTELHVDGAVSATVFVQPRMLGPPGPTTRVYVVVAGKLAADALPVRLRLLPVAQASVNGVLTARARDDVQRIYRLAREAGAGFAVARMADDFPAATASLSFEPKVMRQMFDEGVRVGSRPAEWDPVPPGADAEGQPEPRSGVRFEAPANSR
jgi:predicted acylesterase/phospholipase RssA